MDSTLHYIHNDSDLSTNNSFSPDEERRSKVQVSVKNALFDVGVVNSSSKPFLTEFVFLNEFLKH